MAKKKNKIKIIIIVAIIVAIALAGYFYLNYYFNSVINKYNDSYANVSPDRISLPSTKKQKDEIISNLSQFKKFGDWPVTSTELSTGRGNPFQEKTVVVDDQQQ